MLPYITIFGKDISMYFLMALLGGVIMLPTAIMLAKKRKTIPTDHILYILLYAAIGCLIGSKALYLIISIDKYWYKELSLVDNLKYWYYLLTSGGLVFYGGLLGAIAGIYIYTKESKLPFYETIETIIPAVPLFHAFGRVGCFLAGCCHGIPYDGPLSVTYTNAIGGINSTPLLPVQLFEAIGNLILSAILIAISLKYVTKACLSSIYLISYSVMRFILEFFRGDVIRGSFLSLSTSQWFSIMAFISGFIIILIKSMKNKKTAPSDK